MRLRLVAIVLVVLSAPGSARAHPRDPSTSLTLSGNTFSTWLEFAFDEFDTTTVMMFVQESGSIQTSAETIEGPWFSAVVDSFHFFSGPLAEDDIDIDPVAGGHISIPLGDYGRLELDVTGGRASTIPISSPCMWTYSSDSFGHVHSWMLSSKEVQQRTATVVGSLGGYEIADAPAARLAGSAAARIEVDGSISCL